MRPERKAHNDRPGSPPAMAARSDNGRLVTGPSDTVAGPHASRRRSGHRRPRGRTAGARSTTWGAVAVLVGVAALAGWALARAPVVGIEHVSAASAELLAVPVVYLVGAVAAEAVIIGAVLARRGDASRPRSPAGLAARRRPGVRDGEAGPPDGDDSTILEPPSTAAAEPPAPAAVVSLEALVDAIGAELVELQREFGVRYNARTWVATVLPTFGAVLPLPLLARDLLAVGALGAAGICPDVAGLVSAHPPERLEATARSLYAALVALAEGMKAGRETPQLPPFEAVSWDVEEG